MRRVPEARRGNTVLGSNGVNNMQIACDAPEIVKDATGDEDDDDT